MASITGGSDPDFYQLVAEGRVANYSSGVVSGGHTAVGTSVVWLGSLAATATPYMPTAAVTVEAISASANDTAAGSGARTILVSGLDANFESASAILTMNGTSASAASTQSFIRVTRTAVLTVGTYGGTNAGNITVRASSAGTTFLSIAAAKGLGRAAHFCVPANTARYLYDIHLIVEGTKTVDVRLWTRDNADVVAAPYGAARLGVQYIGIASSSDFAQAEGPIVFPAKTDVWADAVVATGTAAVSIIFIYVQRTGV